ncbi:hypothetical protein SAMN04488126_12316 [Bhargavaea beijingensis]|uniref:ABC-2 family transporter protein n=1 Tax=Bhargavaea beijingensis TaxID=426756 RepID=A0A1G7G381_9BACL|nr:hypothetical protein [Bhargavaea beijingensis]SDE82578.1 hypothetical protein SAMN04488126_12316 [Bhargavaea beijingensis]
MSTLTQPTASNAIRSQFLRNLYGRSGILGSLLALQVIGIALSFSGGNGFGTSDGQITINVVDYSANPVIGLTLLWALISPLYLSSRDSLQTDFTFPGNRMTRHCGNALYLAALVLTASLVVTLVQMASVLFTLIPGRPLLLPDGGTGHYVSLFAVLTGYCLVLSAASYFAGTLFSVSRIAAFSLFALVLVFLRVTAVNELVSALFRFAGDGPPSMILLRCLLLTAFFFLGAIVAGSRQEVKA